MTIYTSEKILPYVYKLTHKTTGQYYIGSRYTKALKLPSHLDIHIYQTSSKIIDRIGFNNFNVEIIAEFFQGEDAWDFEQQLINEHYKDPLILNAHRHSSTGLRFMFKEHTVESRQHLSRIQRGKSKPAELRAKWALTRKEAAKQKGEKNSQFGKLYKFVNDGINQHKIEVSEVACLIS